MYSKGAKKEPISPTAASQLFHTVGGGPDILMHTTTNNEDDDFKLP